MHNPCLSCGACCTLYKVTVEPSETNDQPGGGVPLELTVSADKDRRLMKGTETLRKRCVALQGTVGAKVACGVYTQRPSACRNFMASWDVPSGGNPLCDRARALYGLLSFQSY